MSLINTYNLIKRKLNVIYERYITGEGGDLNISNKTFRVIEITPKGKIIRPELDANGNAIIRKRPTKCPQCLSIETDSGGKAIRRANANSCEWECKVCSYEW